MSKLVKDYRQKTYGNFKFEFPTEQLDWLILSKDKLIPNFTKVNIWKVGLLRLITATPEDIIIDPIKDNNKYVWLNTSMEHDDGIIMMPHTFEFAKIWVHKNKAEPYIVFMYSGSWPQGKYELA